MTDVSHALCLDASNPFLESPHSNPKHFLCIEPFLADFVNTQALKTALDVGLIDTLNGQPQSLQAIQNQFPAFQAVSMLLAQLASVNVVNLDAKSGCWTLTTEFSQTLVYQDLLKAKLEFSNLLAPDLIEHYPLFLSDMPAFIQHSRVFELFAYNLSIDITPENIAATRRWMRFTTCLTRYEGRVIAQQNDFSHVRKHIDIGGNSGEFALQLCKQYPQLTSTVVDLPVVCEVGKTHIQHEPEHHRIHFLVADGLTDPLPKEQDLVTFKSVLHDWPPEACEQFIRQAASTLKRGGEILICERGPMDLSQPVPYGLLPMLLFNRSFRSPEAYIPMLKAVGFVDIKLTEISLETPFMQLTARLP